MLSLRKRKNNKWHIPGPFSDKVIDFANEPSMLDSFVKNTFVDDGDVNKKIL